MRKGSLTIFVSLVMVAVMTLLFAMSECIRVVAMDNLAQEYTDMAVESGFSEFNPYLWSNYKILALDLGYGTDNIGPAILESKVTDYCQCNSDVESGNNYARLTVADCSVGQYGLLTDNNGQPIVSLGIKAAKETIAQQVIDGIQEQINAQNNIEKVDVEGKASSGKSDLDNAKAANAEAKRQADTDNDPTTSSADFPDPGSVNDDPFDAYETLKNGVSNGVLSMVVDSKSISEESVAEENLPSDRELNKGNLETVNSGGVIDKALFIDYLMTNYSYYGNDMKHDGLQYEVEYLLTGKNSDSQCLASVVEQILLTREAANFYTIENTSLELQAWSLAHILADFTLNPAIVQAVKEAIVAMWAFAESILDLRQILAGGKIAIIKNIDQWTSDVFNLSKIGDVNFKANDCNNGIGYKEYLIGMLALRSNNTLGMRAADVMENAISKTEDYKDVKLDNMIFGADITIGFSSKEMFLSLFDGTSQGEDYYFTKNRLLAY